MSDTKIKVAEKFYSLQGENVTSGVPAYFLRLQHCTLECVWCDTLEVWKKGTPILVDDLIAEWEREDLLKPMQEGKIHLVLTGGSPLMQQKALTELLEKVKGDNQYPYVEVETEAVLIPTVEFDFFVDHYNVSPKLANSGMPEEKRIKLDTIKWHVDSCKSFFKFVVTNEGDVREMESTYATPCDIPCQRIYLMPEGTMTADLEKRYSWIAEVCKKKFYNFTTRLQVLIWGKTTGV